MYLSPKDYHRVHMPWTGTLRETVHIPGRLFSVGTDAVGAVSRLFARNERLVCHFDTDFGPMAVVMVGALLVSGVETVWGGVEIPPYGGPVTVKDYRGGNSDGEPSCSSASLKWHASTTARRRSCCCRRAWRRWRRHLRAETPVKLGEALAALSFFRIGSTPSVAPASRGRVLSAAAFQLQPLPRPDVEPWALDPVELCQLLGIALELAGDRGQRFPALHPIFARFGRGR